MKRRIDVSRELRQKAVKLFDVTEQTVFSAMSFDEKRGYSDKAKRIRSYLLQNGAMVLLELPEVETIHDAEGYMRQYFPNGAMLEVEKKTGDLHGYYKGQQVVSFKDIKVRQLEDVQQVLGTWKAN